MVSRVRVLIATTEGPVEVLSLLEEDPQVRSVVCIGGTPKTANISLEYASFVAPGTGIIARLFGHGSFRLDVSGPIDAGSSWQLAILAAHALHKEGRLAGPKDRNVDAVLFATGQVQSIDLSVNSIGGLSEKLKKAYPLLATESAAGRRLIVAWPIANGDDAGADARTHLAEFGAEVLELDHVSELMECLELSIKAPARAADPLNIWQGNPYRGLDVFGEEHEAIFFGRGRAREETLEQLRRAAVNDAAFLLIHGRSGAGKSSLARAV